METKNVILELRTKNGFSQDELAEKIHVTRQAVSRWENGETIPNTETLKLLSKLFGQKPSNSLLLFEKMLAFQNPIEATFKLYMKHNSLNISSPRKLICQCCGMPLDDFSISRETDGTFNEEYCKWCYADGKFVYTSMDYRNAIFSSRDDFLFCLYLQPFTLPVSNGSTSALGKRRNHS